MCGVSNIKDIGSFFNVCVPNSTAEVNCVLPLRIDVLDHLVHKSFRR